MIITHCELYQFRNFDQLRIELAEGLNFFSGQNGQGKSNLLEALHILSNGRSFRSTKIINLINHNKTEAAIACTTQNSLGNNNLRIVLREGRQEYYLNEERVAGPAKFIGNLPTVSFNPDDLDLIKGGPEGRRNLFDKYSVMLNPGTLKIFVDYQRALKNKNSLLKNNSFISPAELRSWNQILAENGYKILILRHKLTTLLNPIVNEIHSEFSKDQALLDFSLANEIPDDATFLMTKYEQQMRAEMERRTTLTGPHRDDIEINLAGRPARNFASQGQSRSIILALKLALIELLESTLEDAPVVLLDDVDSELDEQRSQGFFDLLMAKKRQVLITGTDFSAEKTHRDRGAKVFTVKSGTVSISS